VFSRTRKALNAWWRSLGRRFVAAQWMRLSVGFALGCVASAFVSLFTQDKAFHELLERERATFLSQKMSDGISAYSLELRAVCLVVAIGLAPWITRATVKYFRAWWAGITSLTAAASAILVVWVLPFGTAHPTRDFSVGGFVLLSLLACELWRFQSIAIRSSRDRILPKLAIPTQKRHISVHDSWSLSSSDDPIEEWDQDIIGRASVVEVLAEHIFVHRTPIVELDGELGDGKSSTLNLLRRTIDGHAVIVSFSAWLPGSHETLALDLFRDIATECRRALYMPQVRKASLAYARTISGSVSFLAGLKEVLPTQSQREEIEEIREVLARVPVPIVVLLDEADRMQREELIVLLKILRGASSMPNVTFICAFSEREVRKTLSSEGKISNDYFEKFFPVSVTLGAPDPKMLGLLLQRRITAAAGEGNWFLGTDEKKFRELLEYMWDQSLSQICTNLRKLRLLLNDVTTAAKPVAGEVNTFDLIGIESLQRFEPAIHRMLRKNSPFLTSKDESWTAFSKGRAHDSTNSDEKAFYERLEKAVAESAEPSATGVLLELLFPLWSTRDKEPSRHSFYRSTNSSTFENEKRICSPEYFFVYFRSALPEEMYSEAELSRMLARLNGANNEDECTKIFTEELLAIPAGHPRREDFLWKLGRSVASKLTPDAAEGIAYAAASRAADYAYDLVNVGEAARALNIVYEVAQKLSSSSKAQTILMGAMSRAADDTFAIRLLEFVEYRDRNKILTNFTNIDPPALRTAFLERMRKRYGKTVDAQSVGILQGDWHAFRLWANNSATDKDTEQDFLRRFVGLSRKRLGQTLGFLFPSGYSWSEDPRSIVKDLFSLDEAKKLIDTLVDDGLDERESSNIDRFTEMLDGKWFDINNPES
jgi:hypothetical protein